MLQKQVTQEKKARSIRFQILHYKRAGVVSYWNFKNSCFSIFFEKETLFLPQFEVLML